MTKSEKVWLIVLLGLTAFAYLLNLGLLPLRIDESIRTTVSIEMINSGDYITPTMWGRYYYSKPPLFNWIVIAFWKLFDTYSLFIYRLPAVLSYLGLALFTFFVSRKHIGTQAAMVSAFGVVLSSTAIIRDSMLGYIDPMLALVTLVSFYTIFHFHRQRQYWALFLLSYLLTAIGVLLKGAPSLAFQAITLLTWFLYKRDFKSLFKPSHFAGIGLLLLIVGGYFLVYSEMNETAKYFNGLQHQVELRTPKEYPWYETIFYFIIFPFENLGMLLPMSLFTFAAFRKGIFRRWLGNDFLAFTFLVLLINIIPYWFSPGYRFRYLLMLYPLWFILGTEAHFAADLLKPKLTKLVEYLFLFIGVALVPLFLYWYFIEMHEVGISETIWLTVLTIAVIISLYAWYKWSPQRVYLSLVFIILFRIGYDVGFIPRWSQDEENIEVYKMVQSERIVNIANGRPIRVYGKTPMSRSYAFYLGSEQTEVVHKTKEIDFDYLYLINEKRMSQLKDYEVDVLYTYPLRYLDYTVQLVEISAKE